MDQLLISTGSCTANEVFGVGTTGTLGYMGPCGTTTPFYDYSAGQTVIAGLSYPTINKKDLEVSNETKTHYVFKYVMPGVKPEDLNAFIRNGDLIVELADDKEFQFKAILQDEILIQLDEEDHNQDDIELNLTDGVLTILIAKATPDKQLTVK